MSHEIRTTMNAIIGLSLLGTDAVEDIEMCKYNFEQIYSSGKYLLGLINDILDMSRIESGKIDLNEEFVDSKAIFDSIETMIMPLAKEKNVTLDIDLGTSGAPYIKMDILRTKQIYLNLLNNAIKFSKPGGIVE